MADINITGQGTFSANDWTVSHPTVNNSTVSFHAASQSCKVCFTNSATFGMSGFTVNTGAAQSLPLKAVQDTGFSVVGQNDNCSAGKRIDTDYTITMGGGMGDKKHDRK
jgi:hypothetical protein